MPNIIAVANQKGGVGKTSIVFHLSGALAELGKRVLVIDLDQQGNLSSAFLDDIYTLEKTITDVFLDDHLPLKDIILPTQFECIQILPANLQLSQIDLQLASDFNAQFILADKLDELEDQYDYILVDCPPSLGLATLCALVASQGVIIPMECQEWATVGSIHLQDAMHKVRKRANPKLRLLGYVVNKYDGRRKLEEVYKNTLYTTYGDSVFKTVIRSSIRYVEASNNKSPITMHLPSSEQANTFRSLAKEVINCG